MEALATWALASFGEKKKNAAMAAAIQRFDINISPGDWTTDPRIIVAVYDFAANR
jgi:hypothetical protein